MTRGESGGGAGAAGGGGAVGTRAVTGAGMTAGPNTGGGAGEAGNGPVVGGGGTAGVRTGAYAGASACAGASAGARAGAGAGARAGGGAGAGGRRTTGTTGIVFMIAGSIGGSGALASADLAGAPASGSVWSIFGSIFGGAPVRSVDGGSPIRALRISRARFASSGVICCVFGTADGRSGDGRSAAARSGDTRSGEGRSNGDRATGVALGSVSPGGGATRFGDSFGAAGVAAGAPGAAGTAVLGGVTAACSAVARAAFTFSRAASAWSTDRTCVLPPPMTSVPVSCFSLSFDALRFGGLLPSSGGGTVPPRVPTSEADCRTQLGRERRDEPVRAERPVDAQRERRRPHVRDEETDSAAGHDEE